MFFSAESVYFHYESEGAKKFKSGTITEWKIEWSQQEKIIPEFFFICWRTSNVLVAFSRAAKEHSLLLMLKGISARHSIAYKVKKALSKFRLLTAADTVGR